LISTNLWLFLAFYLWKMMLMYLQKVITNKQKKIVLKISFLLASWRSMTKIAGSWIRIHYSEAWIRGYGSGSTPKCHGSGTLRWRPVLLQTMLKQGHTWTGGVCTTISPCWSPAPSAPRATHRSVGSPLFLQPFLYIQLFVYRKIWQFFAMSWNTPPPPPQKSYNTS
jgi:hypothetical protein